MFKVNEYFQDRWQDFKAGGMFVVDKNKRFQLKVAADVAYLCLYR